MVKSKPKRFVVGTPHVNMLFDQIDGIHVVSRHATRKEAMAKVKRLRAKGRNVVLAVLKTPRIKKVKIHRK